MARGEFSDSEKARLDALLHEKEIDDAISERRKKRIESVKAWAQWIAAVTFAVGIVWDGVLRLVTFIRAQWP